MRVWLDVHLPPTLARWMAERFGVRAGSIIERGLRDSDDGSIYAALREPGSVLITKDEDFVTLVHARGVPPHVVWLRCGNISRAALQRLLEATWEPCRVLLESGERIVEIVGE